MYQILIKGADGTTNTWSYHVTSDGTTYSVDTVDEAKAELDKLVETKPASTLRLIQNIDFEVDITITVTEPNPEPEP